MVARLTHHHYRHYILCLAIFTVTIVISWLPTTVNATVSAQLSAQDIDELETVRLIIRSTGSRETQKLDLSALETDFHVMSNNTSSQYRSVNGRQQSWVDYQITLQPKRTGTLTIPQITVGPDTTPTLSLRVRPLSNSIRQTINELVFFEQQVSAAKIYVQSELVVTRRLLYSNGVQLYTDLPAEPQIKDAVVLTLGETVSSTTQRNGKLYGVVEQRYAIFPERSGTLTIPQVSVTASVRLQQGRRVSRKGVRVSTQAVQITVMPVPKSYPANEVWLPAHNVTLHQVLTPNKNVHVGDTLSHELLVHIEGNIGSISAPEPLNLNDTNFRTYPQNPVINDDTSRHSVAGSRLQTTSIVPMQPGSRFIPGQQVVWWDIDTDQQQLAQVAAIELNISGTGVAPLDEPISTQPVPSPEQEQPDQSASLVSDMFAQAKTWLLAHPLWIGLGLATLAVFVLIAQLKQHLVKIPTISPSTTRLKRNLYNKLKNGNVETIEGALCEYLARRLKLSRHVALHEFSKHSALAAQSVSALNACKFSDDQSPLGKDTRFQLRQAVDALEEAIQDKAGPRGTLPPLYEYG